MADDELDFDELHQAVNQMMTNKGKKRIRPTAVSDDTQRPVAPKPEPKPADDVPVKIEVKRPTPTLQVPPRRRGNAMDIISPSTPPPAPRVNRTAPALQPTQEVKPEPPQPRVTPPRAMALKPAGEPADDVLASLNMKDEDDIPSGAPKSEHKDVDSWPDPLDYHGFKDEPEKKPGKPKEEKALPAPHDALLEPDDAEPAPTMTADRPEGSPFIDAKVEKRPLGAYAPKEDEVKPEPAPAPDTAALPPQPKELSPEVVAVESAEPERHESEGETDINSVRQASITPQYHARDKEPSKGERPVFDTKEYHPPIDATAVKAVPKRRSVWPIIILIVLLLGAAAIGYLWMTGMLDLSKYL